NIGILVVERLIVVVDLRHVRVGENLCQNAPFAAYARLDRPVRFIAPAALPSTLILPILRIADARFRFDIVPPRVLDALPRGPDLLAGDRAGVTADALVEVQDLADLS